MKKTLNEEKNRIHQLMNEYGPIASQTELERFLEDFFTHMTNPIIMDSLLRMIQTNEFSKEFPGGFKSNVYNLSDEEKQKLEKITPNLTNIHADVNKILHIAKDTNFSQGAEPKKQTSDESLTEDFDDPSSEIRKKLSNNFTNRELREFIGRLIMDFGKKNPAVLSDIMTAALEEKFPELQSVNTSDNKNNLENLTDPHELRYRDTGGMDEEYFPLNEGNAFVGAAKKAKEEGKDSFELGGKKYKVTVKKSENKK